MNDITRKRLVQGTLGVAISVIAIALVLRRVSFSEMAKGVSSLDWRWSGGIIAAKVLVMSSRFARWRRIIRVAAPESRARHLFRAVGLAYFANLLLPFRAGDIISIGTVRRHNNDLGLALIAATLFTVRILDALVLSVIVAVSELFATIPEWMRAGTLLLAGAMVATTLLAAFNPLHRFVGNLLPSSRIGELLRLVIDSLSRGSLVLRKPFDFVAVVCWSVVIWAAESASLFFAAAATTHDLTWGQAITVTLLYSVSSLIPSAPAQVGTHQAFTILFLTPLGFSAAQAISVSVILQAGNILTAAAVGGTAMIREATDVQPSGSVAKP